MSIVKNKGGKKPTTLVKNKKSSVSAKYTTEVNAWSSTETYTSMADMLKNVVFDDGGFGFEVKYSDENSSRTVGFSIAEESPYCCGLGEIGELTPKVAKLGPMNAMFAKLFEDYDNRTFIINTTKNFPDWEDFLERSKHFKKCKSFNNPNTSNTVTLWVSTN